MKKHASVTTLNNPTNDTVRFEVLKNIVMLSQSLQVDVVRILDKFCNSKTVFKIRELSIPVLPVRSCRTNLFHMISKGSPICELLLAVRASRQSMSSIIGLHQRSK